MTIFCDQCFQDPDSGVVDTPHPCVRKEGHIAPHRDHEGLTWLDLHSVYPRVESCLDQPTTATVARVAAQVIGAGQGVKADGGKPALDLIDPHFEEEVAKVLTFGANKYDVDNWKRGMSLGKAVAGVLRHLLAVRKGEFTDPETGLSHLAHACCGLMFIFHYQRTDGFKPDDRWRK